MTSGFVPDPKSKYQGNHHASQRRVRAVLRKALSIHVMLLAGQLSGLVVLP
jgi:hypothetical protein